MVDFVVVGFPWPWDDTREIEILRSIAQTWWKVEAGECDGTDRCSFTCGLVVKWVEPIDSKRPHQSKLMLWSL